MANRKIVNIVNEITEEPRFLALGEGKVYKVNNGFQTVLKTMALQEEAEKKGPTVFVDGIEMLLGKEAIAYIKEKDMSFDAVATIFRTALEMAMNADEDEKETNGEDARFQEEK